MPLELAPILCVVCVGSGLLHHFIQYGWIHFLPRSLHHGIGASVKQTRTNDGGPQGILMLLNCTLVFLSKIPIGRC